MENTPSAPVRLRRTLTLWDLILYGVIVIQPVAPMSVFGVLSDRGRGHVVTTILVAMVAMLQSEWAGQLLGRIAGDAPPNRLMLWPSPGAQGRFVRGLDRE